MRVSMLTALALVGFLAACARVDASMIHSDTKAGHFGAGMQTGRTVHR